MKAAMDRAKALRPFRGVCPWICALWTAAGLVLGHVQAKSAPTAAAPVIQGTGLCQFLLHHYTLPQQTEARINQAVGEALKQHRMAFGFESNPDFKVRVRLFGSFEEYQRFVRTNLHAPDLAQGTLNITNLAGFYSTATRELVTWSQRVPSDLANVVLHESSHAILDAHFHWLPLWLMEGCATYFAFPREIQDRHDVLSLEARWALLNYWLQETNLPPVGTFVNLDSAAWTRLDPIRSYTLSWSIFQFLMNSPANRRVLQQFAWGIERGRGPKTDCAALLDQLYPGGVKQLDQDWRRWIVQTGAKVLRPQRAGNGADRKSK